MPNGDPRDGFFYPTLTIMVDFFYNPVRMTSICMGNPSECKGLNKSVKKYDSPKIDHIFFYEIISLQDNFQPKD